MESRIVVWLEVVAVLLMVSGAGVASAAAIGGVAGVALGLVVAGALLLGASLLSDVLRSDR